MPKQNTQKITIEDMKMIYGDEYAFFQEKILSNCYCSNCDTQYTSTIVSFEVFLNDLNDIVLKGFCKTCGNRINRYLETGEVPEFEERIKKIKENFKKVGFDI